MKPLHSQISKNRIGGIMVSMLALISVDLGSIPCWITPKTIKLVFVAFPLRSKSTDWFTRNQNNVSE